jgi:hypothetical protein
MMTKKFIVLGAGLLTVQLLIGCQASTGVKEQGHTFEKNQYKNETMNITEIIENAKRLKGKSVVVSGLFSGWSGKCLGSPPKTRSDWMLESDNVCIYVSGPTPEGTSARPPAKGIGLTVEIEGTVFLDKNNKPYIETK